MSAAGFRSLIIRELKSSFIKHFGPIFAANNQVQ